MTSFCIILLLPWFRRPQTKQHALRVGFLQIANANRFDFPADLRRSLGRSGQSRAGLVFSWHGYGIFYIGSVRSSIRLDTPYSWQSYSTQPHSKNYTWMALKMLNRRSTFNMHRVFSNLIIIIIKLMIIIIKLLKTLN